MASPLLRVPLRPVFLLCDVQERFRPLILHFPAVLHGAATLLKVAAVLGRPAVATEQYPKALGPTCAELVPLLTAPRVGGVALPKMSFGMMTPEVDAHLAARCGSGGSEAAAGAGSGAGAAAGPVVGVEGYDCAVLFGIEAHVCIQQTALELLRRGKQVLIAADATSSQRAGDRSQALRTLLAAGASVSTVESIVMTLIQTADHPNFKELSKLLVAHNAAFATSGIERLD